MMTLLGNRQFTPRSGQWVHFEVPTEALAKKAETFGAWKTRKNKFCGIYSGSSATPEGVIVLPERIMLVNEKGHNVVAMVPDGVANLWVLAPHNLTHLSGEQATKLAADMEHMGCIGIADELEPTEENLDCPPGRRPDIHPKDLRKPIAMTIGHNMAEIIRRGIASVHQELGLPSPEEVEAEEQKAQRQEEKNEIARNKEGRK